MAHRKSASPASPAADAAPTPPAPSRALTVEEIGAPPPSIDPETFDPSEFEWRPVPRRPRRDGWTPDVQRKFIEVLADTGLVSAAAHAVDMSEQSAFRLRRAPGGESFARAWEAATSAAATRLIDVAFTRAIDGVDMPVFDRDGCRIGSKRQYSDRLMMFLLRAYRPDRFRHAHRDERAASEAPPPRDLPVAAAIQAMHPVPPEPHKLMPPDELSEEVFTARQLADIDARYPIDDRERFAPAPVEADAPAATERRQQRHRRTLDEQGWDEDWEDDALD